MGIWLDKATLVPGKEWDLDVPEGISKCSCMLVVLSPDSVSSRNSHDEWSFALKKDKLVIPLLYRDCEIPFRLDRVQYVDFRSNYSFAFSVLLPVLRACATQDPTNISKPNMNSSVFERPGLLRTTCSKHPAWVTGLLVIFLGTITGLVINLPSRAKSQAHFPPSKLIFSTGSSCTEKDVSGCSNLGETFEEGTNVGKDLAVAAKFYGWSCAGGYADGCHNLGRLYDHGTGVGKDATLAVSLYRAACDAGETSSCTDLGTMYSIGRGVVPDQVAAVSLYRKSCDEGNAIGCFNLANHYEEGRGIPQDSVQADDYYRLACKGYVADACKTQSFLHRK